MLIVLKLTTINKLLILKVDFGDFRFVHIEPKVVRFVSGVATALLGSGGLLTMPLLLVYFAVNSSVCLEGKGRDS